MTAIILITALGQQVNIPWTNFVWSVAWAESRMDNNAIGSKGERGAWQFTRAGWSDAMRLLGWKLSFMKAHDPGYAYPAAGKLLNDIQSRLAKIFKRQPTANEVFCAWNMGMKGFRSRKYMVSRAPKVTRDGIERMQEFLIKGTK